MIELQNSLIEKIILRKTDESGDFVIKEPDPGAKLREITFKKMPTDILAFTLDYVPNRAESPSIGNCKSLSWVFKLSAKNINKKCDLVVIQKSKHDESHINIYVADMKSEKPSHNSVLSQLKNSEVFCDFMLKLNSLYSNKRFIIEFKRIVFFVPKSMTLKSTAYNPRLFNRPKKRDSINYIGLSVDRHGRSIFNYDYLVNNI